MGLHYPYRLEAARSQGILRLIKSCKPAVGPGVHRGGQLQKLEGHHDHQECAAEAPEEGGALRQEGAEVAGTRASICDGMQSVPSIGQGWHRQIALQGRHGDQVCYTAIVSGV